MTELENYMEARERNRTIFTKENPELLETFEIAIEASRRLGTILTTERDAAGKSHAGLAPFFLIFQRSTISAFEALSATQAFQAWVRIRPGIESTLIMGKWVQDPGNAQIWERRFEDRKAYQRLFQGKELGRGALPRGAEIQNALTLINDEFLHPILNTTSGTWAFAIAMSTVWRCALSSLMSRWTLRLECLDFFTWS